MKKRLLLALGIFVLIVFVVCAQEATSVRVTYNGAGYAEYIGKAAPGTAEGDLGWQIYKLSYDGSNNVTSRVYANGNYSFIYSWTLRATYDYTK